MPTKCSISTCVSQMFRFFWFSHFGVCQGCLVWFMCRPSDCPHGNACQCRSMFSKDIAALANEVNLWAPLLENQQKILTKIKELLQATCTLPILYQHFLCGLSPRPIDMDCFSIFYKAVNPPCNLHPSAINSCFSMSGRMKKTSTRRLTSSHLPSEWQHAATRTWKVRQSGPRSKTLSSFWKTPPSRQMLQNAHENAHEKEAKCLEGFIFRMLQLSSEALGFCSGSPESPVSRQWCCWATRKTIHHGEENPRR